MYSNGMWRTKYCKIKCPFGGFTLNPKKMNYDSEHYFDQEIQFSYEGKDYLWIGDYTIEYYGEDESEFAPAYGEMEVSIDHTSSLLSYEDGCDLIPTASILLAVELEIERNQ